MMKRILVAIVSLMMVFSLCACQPTPEKGTAAQKNSERMIENAKKTAGAEKSGKSLAERCAIPATYRYEAQGADGKLHITADARVAAPERNTMPIYRVKATDFSQEQVSAFFKALCGNAEMWETPERMTKRQIRDLISDMKKNESEKGGSDDPDFEKQIAELQEKVKSAPDSIEDKRSDGTLYSLAQYADQGVNREKAVATYTGLNAYEKNGGKTFQVRNNSDVKNGVIINEGASDKSVINVERNALMSFSDWDAPGMNIAYMNGKEIGADLQLDESIQSNIDMTPLEAKHTVQALLDETKSDMKVERLEIRWGEEGQSDRYAYKVFCVRESGGIVNASIAGGSGGGGGKEAVIAPWWAYESLEFTVNPDGICYMEWLSPLEVIEVVADDVQLVPFSEIQEVFEKMAPIKYEPHTEFMTEYRIDISTVTLSLERIAEQDSPGRGFLVPAWNFYGEATGKHEEDEIPFHEYGISFLSVNAIDGSVIDTDEGQ